MSLFFSCVISLFGVQMRYKHCWCSDVLWAFLVFRCVISLFGVQMCYEPFWCSDALYAFLVFRCVISLFGVQMCYKPFWCSDALYAFLVFRCVISLFGVQMYHQSFLFSCVKSFFKFCFQMRYEDHDFYEKSLLQRCVGFLTEPLVAGFSSSLICALSLSLPPVRRLHLQHFWQ